MLIKIANNIITNYYRHFFPKHNMSYLDISSLIKYIYHNMYSLEFNLHNKRAVY
jgi:hypothetical protein